MKANRESIPQKGPSAGAETSDGSNQSKVEILDVLRFCFVEEILLTIHWQAVMTC